MELKVYMLHLAIAILKVYRARVLPWNQRFCLLLKFLKILVCETTIFELNELCYSNSS